MAFQPKGKTITFEDIQKYMALIPVASLRETEMFLRNNHWQDGKAWIGFKNEQGTENGAEIWKTVCRLFKAENVIGGMVDRLRGAVLGKAPDWTITAKDDKNKDLFEKIAQAVKDWWDEKDIHAKLKEFETHKAAYGKPGIRVYIPPGLMDGESFVDGTKDFAEILSKITIEVPRYDAITNGKDVAFGNHFTIVRLAKDDEVFIPSQTQLANTETVYEVCYINEKKQTVLRKVDSTGTGNNEVAKDLGGLMLHYVIGDYDNAIISDTVKLQQKGVNYALTGENFAGENLNLPETTFFNAEEMTEEKTVGGKTEIVKTPLWTGAGVVRYIRGLITETATGEELNPASMQQREGADPKKFAEIAANDKRRMHEEAKMGWVYAMESEYSSGKSKQQSKSDYMILLVDEKTIIETLGIWLFKVVIRLCFNFSNQTALNDAFNVTFTAKPTIGQVTNEDKKVMQDEVFMGARTLENYIVTAEINDDPDSEISEYKEEQTSGYHDNFMNVAPANPNIPQAVDPNAPKPLANPATA